MLIRSKLSWELPGVKKPSPSFSGYYESGQKWDEIRPIYLEKKEVIKLIKFYDQSPDWQRWLRFEDYYLAYSADRRGGTTTIYSQEITFGAKTITVWKFSFPEKWMDLNVKNDNRLFSWSDIQEAVLHGLTVGIEMGKINCSTYQGLNPNDYAIKYTSEQPGS